MSNSDVLRLITECKDVIIQYTPAMGSFNPDPRTGYTAREPEEFKYEFLDIHRQYSLNKAFPVECGKFKSLIRVVNEMSLGGLFFWLLKNLTDSPYSTFPHSLTEVTSVFSYTVLEAMLRRLSPIVNNGNGKLSCNFPMPNGKIISKGQRVSLFADVLQIFEATTLYKDLRITN